MSAAATDREAAGAGTGTGGGAAGALAFVTVRAAGLGFALPLAEVLEVVRPPEVVRVPLGPPGLDGLAQWHGAAMPVLDLGRALGQESGSGDGSGDGAGGEGGTGGRVVVVRHQGQPVGLRVDGMAGMVRAAPDRIDPIDDAEAPVVDAALLAGVLRDGAVAILDSGALIDRQFGAGWAAAAPRSALAGGIGPASPAIHPATAAPVDRARLLVFGGAGQEFALPVEQVREVLPAPAGVTRMARAKAHLLGVVPLRDRLLPLIGLRALFGLGAAGEGSGGRVVVVQAGGGDALVGVVVDEVREILGIDRALIDPVPPLLAREAEFEDLDGIARAGDGGRLVSVLSAARMFRHGLSLGGEGEAAMERSGTRGNAAIGATIGATVDADERFVVFRLAGAEYGLPVAAVQEVLRRPDAPVPLPNAPDFVAGVLTLRGAVLPLVDLRRLLGLPADGGGRGGAPGGSDRGRVVVIAQGEARVGLLVDGTAGLLAVPADRIGPAPSVSDAQRRLIRRVATLAGEAGSARLILLMESDGLLDMDRLSALLPSAPLLSA
ncbi:purine-binding chemotaxis protein CheW [Azospirillum agricola]|uniref:chemotaxis protein CheW n=1 Tax=Azospirillum agricola TaxID=1720247 RepID=UPI001AE21F7B|nr:chemotaxis protein CheW [Azospirillum agricola]MBP2228539.1 purine-binding chemotaxis protein CheW [Azospirillum agricola]